MIDEVSRRALPGTGFSKVDDPVERLVRVRGETPDLASDVRDLMQIHQREHHAIEHREHLGHKREADAATILPYGHIAAPVETIFNGIITNDKFCMSRIKHLPKASARKGFTQEIQYPSEATEQECCPKVETDEKTAVEHSTLQH